MSEPTNSQRAEWALKALKVFMAETGVDPDDAIADLVCNLGHLSDSMKEVGDFYDGVRRGIAVYNFEADQASTLPAAHETLEMPEVTITVAYRNETFEY